MPFKIIGRTLKKVITVGAALIGAGTGGALSTGQVLTGEIILDAILLIGSLIIIGVNGKDGVPDWLIRRVGGTPPAENKG